MTVLVGGVDAPEGSSGDSDGDDSDGDDSDDGGSGGTGDDEEDDDDAGSSDGDTDGAGAADPDPAGDKGCSVGGRPQGATLGLLLLALGLVGRRRRTFEEPLARSRSRQTRLAPLA